jgi:hypothetical protein
MTGVKDRPVAQVAAAVVRAKQVVAVAGMSRQSFAICPFVDGQARFLTFSGAPGPLSLYR